MQTQLLTKMLALFPATLAEVKGSKSVGRNKINVFGNLQQHRCR